jgi:hypothetical protein
MFSYYARAKECYAFLIDVDISAVEEYREDLVKSFRDSKWFTRGWTLQELIAPGLVLFLNSTWQLIGRKGRAGPSSTRSANSVIRQISSTGGRVELHHIADKESQQDFIGPEQLLQILNDTTGIPKDVLLDKRFLREKGVAQKMSWASNRVTTRAEDEAYCLLGLFGINMPLLYGEGSNAFRRLQLELLKATSDESIFAWHRMESARSSDLPDRADGMSPSNLPLLAPITANFAKTSEVLPCRAVQRLPYTVTNQGLEFRISANSKAYYIRDDDSHLLVTLNCTPNRWDLGSSACFMQLQRWGCGHWVVVKYERKVEVIGFEPLEEWRELTADTTIYIHLERPAGRDPVCGTDIWGKRP